MILVVFMFFFIVIILEFFYITLLTTKFKNYNQTFTIIPIYGKNSNIELLIRKHVFKVKLLPFKKDNITICLDLGMDQQTKKICEIMRDNYSFIRIYNLEEFKIFVENYKI